MRRSSVETAVMSFMCSHPAFMLINHTEIGFKKKSTELFVVLVEDVASSCIRLC